MPEKKRRAHIKRKTKETEIDLQLHLDGRGRESIETTIPFLNHMLSTVAKHGLFDLKIRASGDTHVDDHHLTEDLGIVLGQAFSQALGERKGIYRFGYAYCPLDEALVRCVVDFSGRPYLVYQLKPRQKRLGSFDTELVEEFYKGFVMGASCNLQVAQIQGRNSHHIIEASFKAFALSTSQAIARRERALGIPSTKGQLV